MLKHIDQISEQAFLLDFGSEINIKLSKYIIAYSNYILKEIEKNKRLGILNCVPSYNKILIQFKPKDNIKDKIKEFLLFANKKNISFIDESETVEIPICYDDDFALDIEDISKRTNLSKNEIIETHLNTDFYVYMIGFMPGLPFMGNLDQTILIPRKLSPRVEVPAGSVAIVDNLCVIYPNASPGGWNIIGRTPQIMFNKNNHNPNLLRAGFKVKFKKISKKQFTEFAKNNET